MLSMASLFASRELSNFPCILTEMCFHSMKLKMAAQWHHSTLWVSPTSTPLRSIPTYYMGTKYYNFSFLAHGDLYGSLANRFRLGTSTIHGIIPETCNAIYQVLQPIVLKEPDATDWARIERGFWRRWDFPNCIAAIDGKHCMIQSPPNSGSLYYNSKGYFSLVLMALVDHQYKFTYIDVGEYGSNSDSNVFRNSNLGTGFMQGHLDVPAPKSLPNFQNMGDLPYCLVEDEAFPLRMDLMRPYPWAARATLPQDQLVFNYRLSRARRIVENTFGILAQRFRIYNKRMQLSDYNADIIIKATCTLHNFLTKNIPIRAIENQLNPNQEPYLGRDGAMQPIQNLHGHHSANDAIKVGDIYKRFFKSRAGGIW